MHTLDENYSVVPLTRMSLTQSPTSRDIPTLLHIRAKLTSHAMKWNEVVMERKEESLHSRLSRQVLRHLTKMPYSDEIIATSETVATLISSVDNWPAADVDSVVDSVSTSAFGLHKSVSIEQIRCAVRPVVELLKSTLHDSSRSLNDMVNVG